MESPLLLISAFSFFFPRSNFTLLFANSKDHGHSFSEESLAFEKGFY